MNLRPDRVEAAFSQAVKQPSVEAREAFLQEFCGEDEALLGRLRELLLAYDGADEFLEKPPVVERTASPDDPEVAAEFARLKPEEAGERIGPYKLLEQIGEGGFGVVWVAEQERPVRRRVALKIIKLGMDTKEVIARFEQERQALAMMEHPNIARVFDAGATQFGRPFFVMELVRGIKITDYCDQAKLPTSERLKLFILVCHAVQHAHQKGIIHRDLKPSNIMVTLHDGVPVPKVIDFGVAKATQQQRLTDLTVYTQFDQMIGTPLYMSPEQAEMSGLDIDTRSDIYSLGVLLYELLAGRTPFDPQELLKAGYDEMRRVIREQEPQKPSTFLSTMAADVRTTVARHRHIEGAKLINAIQGDLDWIVMKALEKDRTRRYETANGLASDIQRHLADEPVLARPATQLYRFQRMVRRNKVAFAAAAAVAAALVVGLTASVWQAVRAEHEATRAQDQAVRAVGAEKRTSAVLEDLRAAAPAFAEQARALVAKEQFDGAIDKLDYALKLRPDSAEYLLAKADLLQCQLRLAEAAAAYRAVLALAPNDARAKTNAALCDKLLAVNADPQKLPRGSLSELFTAMQTEQRSAAELTWVGRLLHKDGKILLAYWLERLKGLPIPPETPLEQRLKMREDGLFSLDLSKTKITDLRPLEGMPLGVLNCDECVGLEDLGPLRGMPLKELYVRSTPISDVSPLKTLPALERLYASAAKITDIAALRGLPLKELAIGGTGVADLSPLRGMPLEFLAIEYLPVNDLSPLAGMPLKTLYATRVPAKDFSPLADLPLETVSLQNAPLVRDLGFLLRMPLRELVLYGCAQASNFSVLSHIPTLELLVLPREAPTLPEAERAAISELKTHPKLRQLDSEPTAGRGTLKLVRPKDRFWLEWDRQAQFFGPLRKAGGRVNLDRTLPDGTWAVTIRDQAVSDIACLKGAPISVLVLFDMQVTDLSPLEGMPLKLLGIEKTNVTNLRPLKGLPLTELRLDRAASGIDVSVLAEVPTLERITLPPDPMNLEALRTLPNLKYISFEFDSKTQLPTMTSEQFWKQPLSAEKLSEQARFAEAADLLEERIKAGRSADERMDWFMLAAVELAGGDHKRYRATCTEMVKRFKNTSVVNEADSTAKVCLLAPDSGIAVADIAALEGTRARVLEGDQENRHWFFLTNGLSEYRAGRWAQAAEQLHKMDTEWPASKAAGSALLAMTCQQQKNREAAMTELNRAREQILPHWHGKAGDPDWLAASLFLQEAEKLIGGAALDTGKK